MRLVHATTGEIHFFSDPSKVRYVFFSHPWFSLRDDEWPGYDSIGAHEDTGRLSSQAILCNVLELVRKHGFDYAWIDRLCVKKACSADVSETVLSLSSYLENADCCLAYLADFTLGSSFPTLSSLRRCKYWNRAWTLPQIIVPRRVLFYDSSFQFIGDRSSGPFSDLLSCIMRVDGDVLRGRRAFQDISIARRMSWAAGRESRRSEDTIYALLGLFNILMPVMYGEGETRALRRLQQEIIKSTDDMSLLAWSGYEKTDSVGAFASGLHQYHDSGSRDIAKAPFKFQGFVTLTNRGLLVQGMMSPIEGGLFLDLGAQLGPDSQRKSIGLLLQQQSNGTFTRAPQWMVYNPPMNRDLQPMQIMMSCEDSPMATTPDPHSKQLSSSSSRNDQTTRRITQRSRFTTPTANNSLDSDTFDMGRHIRQEQSVVTQPEDTPPLHSYHDWIEVGSDTEGSDVDLGSMVFSKISLGGAACVPATRSSTPASTISTADMTLADTFIDCGQNSPGLSLVPQKEELPGTPDYTLQPVQAKMELVRGIKTDDIETIRAQLLQPALISFHSWSNIFLRLVGNQNRRIKQSSGPSRRLGRVRKRRPTNGGVPLELACPFFRRYPDQYLSCLRDHSLRTFSEVKEHVLEHHHLPYYCPTCKDTFELAAERNKHIVGRTCSLKTGVTYIGVSGDQKVLIDDIQRCLSRESQWEEMWQILFPDDNKPKSPFLCQGLELKVANMRAFWRLRGPALVHTELKGAGGIDALDGSQETKQLLSRVLSDAIDNLLAGSNLLTSYVCT